MGRTGPGVVLVVTAFALSGCGTVLTAAAPSAAPAATTQAGVEPTAPVDAAGSGAGISSGRDAPSVTLPTGPVFPLTLRRTGGIADFHDTVVLSGDGLATVDTTSISGRTCRLSATQSAQLLVGLSTLRLSRSPSSPAAAAADGAETSPPSDGEAPTDPITVTVTDVNARPVDLTDPSLGQIAALVSALVTDVTLTRPAVTPCSDPSPSPSGADASSESTPPSDTAAVG